MSIRIQAFFLASDLWNVKNPSGLKAFGTHLRILREGQNLSQQELADLSDLAKTTIQRVENAKFSVSLDVLICLAKALNIPLSKLVEFSLPKEKGK